MLKSFVKFLIIIGLIVMAVSTLNYCNKTSKEQKEAAKIPVELKLIRLDKILYQANPKDLNKIRKQYPLFFSSQIPDSVFIEKMTNPIYRELFFEVKKAFEDDDDLVKKTYPTLQLIKYYFPEIKLPHTLVTLVSDMDYEKKVIFHQKK